MELKVKRLNEDAVLPSKAHPGDAGMDLTATGVEALGNHLFRYSTGLAIEIPEGYVGLIFPRSSIYKTGCTLRNSVGVVDSGYQGEIKFIFEWTSPSIPTYNIGDRVGQLVLMPIPDVSVVEVDELSESIRGVGGFGSTGK